MPITLKSASSFSVKLGVYRRGVIGGGNFHDAVRLRVRKTARRGNLPSASAPITAFVSDITHNKRVVSAEWRAALSALDAPFRTRLSSGVY